LLYGSLSNRDQCKGFNQLSVPPLQLALSDHQSGREAQMQAESSMEIQITTDSSSRCNTFITNQILVLTDV
jgi:hypothetical protein